MSGPCSRSPTVSASGEEERGMERRPVETTGDARVDGQTEDRLAGPHPSSSLESSSSWLYSSDSEVDDETVSKTCSEENEGWLEGARRAGRNVWSRFRRKEKQQNGKGKEGIKYRLWSAWNNMKYSTMLQTDHKDQYGDHQIVLLGEIYFPDDIDPTQGFDQFFLDYYSRIWLTYRSGFEEFPGSTVRSDCGWGCMLRTAQMMAAHAVVLLRLGREWRWNPRKASCSGTTLSASGGQMDILELFEDKPSAPLGLHRMIALASEEGSYMHRDLVIGRWFTPSESLGLLSRAIRSSQSSLTAGLATVVCMDGRLIVPVLERESRLWTRTLLLFVCLRLGAHSVNKVYHRHLHYLLSMPNTLGIAGGKPNHSTYFIGYHNEQLIYLDPHVSHPYIPLEREFAIDGGTKRKHTPLSSYHCRLLSKMPFSDIDPSCAIGFLIRSKDEFEESMRYLNLNQVIDVELGRNLGSKRTRDPLFTVLHEEPQDITISNSTEQERQHAEDHGFELL